MRLRILAMPLLLTALAAAAPRLAGLRCEYRVNPFGIDVPDPRLSWLLAADPGSRGVRQTAYRVLAASSPEKLRANSGDLWDSGRVASDESVHVVYRGKPLHSGAKVYWKAQIWDQDNHQSPWSDAAFWTMGLLQSADWEARWIGRDEPRLYKDPESPYHLLEAAKWIAPAKYETTVTIPEGRTITRAICVLGAEGGFELSVNGRPAGKGGPVQMPEVIDIADRLRTGANNIAVNAPGARNRPAGLIGAVRVEFASGDPITLRTGASWSNAKELGSYGMAPWGNVGFTEERVLPARMLRKEFDAAQRVARATAYISGLGLSELYVNGAKIGTGVLSPGLTEYDKRVFYVTHDVTRNIVRGRNTVGVILGNGRYWGPRSDAIIHSRSYGYPKARVQIEMEYADGSTYRVVSDSSWKLTTDGPMRANNEYDGERYDARREIAGWSRPGFDDSRWEQAQLVAAPAGTAVAQMAEPLRVVETLKPVKVTRLQPGKYIVDMGQNMVGWCRLHVNGSAGTRVTLRHAETLRPDGTLYLDNLRTARATDVYILKGAGPETWEPRFTYHGFRYVEVSGTEVPPTIEGRVVHDDMTKIADFASSSTLLNQIHHNILWGVRGNYRSIPTDCPQRDERQGWLGDRSVVSRGESYLFDVAAFYTKWTTDLTDSQRPTGSIPNVAPPYWVLYSDNVTWPGTYVLVPGMLYDQYGDVRVIERNYAGMKRWVDYMRGFLKGGLMPRDTYGDWCVPPESPQLIHSQDPARKTDGTLLGTAYYYEMLKRMSRYARLIGKEQDAAGFDSLAGEVGASFHRHFFDPAHGMYSNGTQTSSILPLAFGITPPENRGSVFARLIDKIENESKGHVGTGLVGAQWLMRTLTDNGRADVAYQIASQKTYPGWGYMIEKGATTIWELWNGDTADPAMNSGNHVMQIGDLGVWMYEYLAGIRPDPEKPGFQHVIIRPYPAGDLSFVRASHRGPYGPISNHWRREAGRLHMETVIPPNSYATVYLPAAQRPQDSPGAKFVRMEAGAAVYEIGSGTYTFTAQL